MGRNIRIAAAQMGATHLRDPRPQTLQRMLSLLSEAALQGAQLVLFPETAFTTFFPRHVFTNETELASFFEKGDITKNEATAPLFDSARDFNIDLAVGFAEDTGADRFNTCIYYHARTGSVLAKYRKIHLPGDFNPFQDPKATNQLEKRYFQPGNLGFECFRVPGLDESLDQADDTNPFGPILGMIICNDRRWPEAWRCLGLQGVELVLCGYNTTAFAPELLGSDPNQNPAQSEDMALFHHKLVMQANSYMNSCFSVCAARAGLDDGKYALIGGSCIVGPEGEVLAEAKSKGDEVVIAEIDLSKCEPGKTRTFDFARHRRVEAYRRIVEQTGVIVPQPRNFDYFTGAVRNGSTDTNGPWARRISNQSNVDEAISPVSLPSVTGCSSTKSTIRVLLINPNATKSMTINCLNMVEPTLPPDVEVIGFTAPPPAPSAIEGAFDNVMSSAASMRALIPLQIKDNYDAFLVACYSDHALIKMLREEFDIPCIGIMEASLFAARTLGGKFGIVATSKRSSIAHWSSVRAYGMETFCAGIKACQLGVLDLERKPRDEVLRIMTSVALQLVEVDGAEVLTLGCAGMSDMKNAVEEAVETIGGGVQVIDGVVAGVHHLVGLVRTKSRTAKRGLYASSSAARHKRGQLYV